MLNLKIFSEFFLILSFLTAKVACSSCRINYDESLGCSSLEDLLNYPNPANQTMISVFGVNDNELNVFSCDESIFENFTSAEEFSLRRVKILHVSEECFMGLNGLKVIDLRYNYLTNIYMGSFRPSAAMKVKTINLKGNKISAIYFANVEMPEVENLDVSDNRLKSFRINRRIFHKILELNLGKNQISTFKIESETLKSLDLSGNRIKSFDGSSFVLPNLEEITLEGNFLTTITPDMFANMPKLINIRIPHNHLEKVSLPEFIKIRDIDLGYNKIKNISDVNIAVDHRMDGFLILQSNKFFELDQTNLNIDKLNHFHCSKCSIYSIDKFFFANTFRSLRTLTLQFNYVTTLDIF
ncbi:chaoptin-like [Lutzomyia longipalpis]|uniref:chaoptin-like n=1 Tax=Lutzomyia longipalpis TaxID=7200 RepID=UPI0024837609|nr:chaoptin-like [Lutzomyia longipalpis]